MWGNTPRSNRLKTKRRKLKMSNEKRDQKNVEILRQLKQGIISDKLKSYSGWGGLRESIYDRSIYRQLKTFLTDAEINNIKATFGNAYFTPAPMIKALFAILGQHGFTGGKILEPAAGNGAFIEHMPAKIRKNSKIEAVEIEMFSAQILGALYPEVVVHNKGFEAASFKADFDLVIGNPPYSSKCLFDIDHADLKEYAMHHYFFAKSFRLLRDGGIVAMVLPSFCLDNRGSHVRTLIYKEGGRLLDAYRLPDDLFADAKVTVDLVVIKKDRTANQIKWQEVIKIDEVAGRSIFMNEYFVNNPTHVLGELEVIDAYGRKLLTCRGDHSAYDLLNKLLGGKSLRSSMPDEQCLLDTYAMIEECDLQIKHFQEKKTKLVNISFRLEALKTCSK